MCTLPTKKLYNKCYRTKQDKDKHAIQNEKEKNQNCLFRENPGWRCSRNFG